MTVQTDLQTALETYINSGVFQGTLAEVSADKKNLEDLLEILQSLSGSSSITANTAIEYGAGATTAKTQRVVVASDSAIQPATTRATSVICLTTALAESSIALSAVKILELDSRTNTPFRFAFTSGNTINTQNFTTVRTGNQEYQPDVNFTGTIFFSAESLPTPITVAACSTTNGSPTVTSANSFAAAVIGQAVSGTGIPASTFIIRRAVDGLSITLGDANGAAVNATATGSVTLTFSGAVIRISRWT